MFRFSFFHWGCLHRGSFALSVTEHPLFLCTNATYFEEMSWNGPVRVIESVIIISFELRFIDPAGLHAFVICPSLWVDSFIPWSCLCCGGVVVSHPVCCNNLDVRCSRQEGTGVAPAHQAPMPQKPLHNCAQLNSHVSLWQPDAFVRNCVTHSHLVDWFDASFELAVAFWLCSFFALFFTQPSRWNKILREQRVSTNSTRGRAHGPLLQNPKLTSKYLPSCKPVCFQDGVC